MNRRYPCATIAQLLRNLMKHLTTLLRLVWLFGLLSAVPAMANERHFTLSYESATLPAGAARLTAAVACCSALSRAAVSSPRSAPAA